jgi:hypothetical protein
VRSPLKVLCIRRTVDTVASMAAAQEEEDYVYYGTALQNEEESKAGQYKKDVKDASATRGLPVWKQVSLDKSSGYSCIRDRLCTHKTVLVLQKLNHRRRCDRIVLNMVSVKVLTFAGSHR